MTSGGAGAACAWEDAGGAVTAVNNATANELVTIGSTTTELDAEANLTFSGSALQCTATLTVGVDDTGHDVKFFGATASSHMLWDESADDLNLIASGLGVITAKDLGVGVHIRTADSGGSVDGAADELVIEGSAHNGMTFLTGTTQTSTINFGDSGDNNIGIVEYNHNTNKMHMYTNAALAMTIDSIGAITKPLQPCFFGTSGIISNCTGDETELTCTPVEVTDRNADFSSQTFTAPVTGLYMIMFNCFLSGLAAAHTAGRTYISTSNRGLYNNTDFGAVASGGTTFGMTQTVITDLDASDTVQFKVKVDEGDKTVDLQDTTTFGIWLLG